MTSTLYALVSFVTPSLERPTMLRPPRFPVHFPLACIAACTLALSAVPSRAAPVARIHELAQQEKTPLLDTLRDLVNIESGSKDVEGLARLAALIAERLARLGGKVEIIEPADVYRMEDTPEKPGAMVHAEFKGTGSKRIMLIAHMDTVYLRGMLKDQPFRIDGERAYGLGIADDKQGVALILHTVAMLQALKFADYGTLTVLINGDEEISSPGARHHHADGRRAGRRVLLRRRWRGRPPAPRHQRRRLGLPDGGRQGLARRLGAGQGRQCTGRTVPPGAAIERPVAEGPGPDPELDGLAGRHQPQRDSGTRQCARGRKGAESIRFRRA
jgi:Peptidase family M20/M25/M40